MFHFLCRTVSRKLHSLRNHAKFISTTCSTSSKKGNSFTVSYLIDTCGFSPERAASASKYLNLQTSQKPDLVIQFFKNHGFKQTQLLGIIRRYPRYLVFDPHKTLKPKIDFFISKGFSKSDIPKLTASCPRIFNRSLQNEIIPCFDFFDNMFRSSRHRFMKTVVRHSGILFDLEHYLEPNMKLLREEGVPESHIVRFIEIYPSALKTSCKKFKETVREVKELGFSPVKWHFVAAIHVKLGLSRSMWAAKEGIYRKWGWTDDHIFAAFRLCPWCFANSGNKIEAVMDFVVNKLGYSSSAIAKYPVIFTMSLEKRLIPRGTVVQDLLSKGLVNDTLSLSAVFQCNESAFLDRFINSHAKEADELLKLYQAKVSLAE